MVSTSSTCLHTLPGIFEASGGGRGTLLSTTNPEDSIPPCTQEKSTQLPWCGYRENCATLLRLSGNQRYTWIFVVFEKEITSNLDYYLFNQVQKKCMRSNFHSCCWFVSTCVPKSPCCFLYGLRSYFPLFKEMFFSPLLLHETATWAAVQKGAAHTHSPVKCAKQTGSSRAQLPPPAPPAALLPHPSNGIGQPGAKLLLRAALIH